MKISQMLCIGLLSAGFAYEAGASLSFLKSDDVAVLDKQNHYVKIEGKTWFVDDKREAKSILPLTTVECYISYAAQPTLSITGQLFTGDFFGIQGHYANIKNEVLFSASTKLQGTGWDLVYDDQVVKPDEKGRTTITVTDPLKCMIRKKEE
jgi:hypothetical protein